MEKRKQKHKLKRKSHCGEHTLSRRSLSTVRHCCCSSLHRAVDDSKLSAVFFVLRFCSSKLTTVCSYNRRQNSTLNNSVSISVTTVYALMIHYNSHDDMFTSTTTMEFAMLTLEN